MLKESLLRESIKFMDHDDQAEEIRRAMAQVRRDVDANTAEVISHAREMADWRYHVRKYPGLAVCAAAAAGYLLVPASRPKFAQGQALGLASSIPAATAPGVVQKSSLGQQVITAAARLLLRNGLPLIAARRRDCGNSEANRGPQIVPRLAIPPRPFP